MNPTTELNTIFGLDLDPIKVKLMHKESGEGWTREHVDAVEFEYRRFLCLMKLFPHEQTAPLFDVDIFWHRHILDTMKYATDCEQIFGYFLHHVPDSGQRGEDDEAAHHANGARMQELYEATFGEAYVRHEAGDAVTARSQRATAKTAWCAPTTPQAAWCAPTAPEAAWCVPTASKAAWCAPTASKAAWCVPTAPKAAWCVPATPKTAWSAPATAITACSQAVAPNDRLYSRPVLAIAV